MPLKSRQSDFEALRLKFPWFSYESFTYSFSVEKLEIKFRFNLAGKYTFLPTAQIPLHTWMTAPRVKNEEWDNLVFHIGLIELISYWKAACPPRVILKPAQLTESQVRWWKKLYYNGLGEFFHVNGIQTDEEDFMKLENRQAELIHTTTAFRIDADAYLVPIGGGKDSAVTLELLKGGGFRIVPLIMNPRKATLDTIHVAGFNENESVIIHRTLDPTLLRLNEEGFLNGHTPFSALLAFYTLVASKLTGINNIALSNESSANESTVAGSHVNHQYSKSFQFEKDFREYVQQFIGEGYRYFSFLRPLLEIQIAQLFSKFTAYHTVFRSCNAGSKTDSWCGACPKCLFAWIILAPFTKEKVLEDIFGKNLMNDIALLPYLEELTGQTPTKPFECVGTVSEVKAALQAILAHHPRPLPSLLEHSAKYLNPGEENLKAFLETFNEEHFLNSTETSLLKKALNK